MQKTLQQHTFYRCDQVAPEMRGQGLGRRMVLLGAYAAPRPARAEIKAPCGSGMCRGSTVVRLSYGWAGGECCQQGIGRGSGDEHAEGARWDRVLGERQLTRGVFEYVTLCSSVPQSHTCTLRPGVFREATPRPKDHGLAAGRRHTEGNFVAPRRKTLTSESHLPTQPLREP